MEWHPNLKPTFLPRPPDQSSFNFLFNYNFEPPFHGVDLKQPEMMMAAPPPERGGYGGADSFSSEKKKRLTTDQLESLENSFQEEIKLDPDRKMKLARELGLQPRQVAVWFQNRRARWKAKQLERLYDSVRLELDAVSREKQKLQEEVVKLRAILMEQATRNNNNKQVSIEVSGDDTVESTSAAAGRAASAAGGVSPQQSVAECQYLFSAVDEYNAVASPAAPYWPANIPSYPC